MLSQLISNDWQWSWEPVYIPMLELTIRLQRQGELGLAKWCGRWYPACSKHGAMNLVTADAPLWRCLNCNIGANYGSSF